MVFETAAFVVGRLLLGGFFLMNGANHFTKREMLVGYAASKGVPRADLFIPLTGLLLLAGGLSILLWVYVPVGVLLLAVFLTATSLQMHDFWAVDEAQRAQEMTQFMKNMALLGAVLLLLNVQPAGYALPL